MHFQYAIITALMAATAMAASADGPIGERAAQPACKEQSAVVGGECYYFYCDRKIMPIEDGGKRLYAAAGKDIKDCARKCSPNKNDCVFVNFNVDTKTCIFFGGPNADYEDYNLYDGKPKFDTARWVPDPQFC